MEKQKQAFALVSLILGIIGLVFSFIPIINNLAAILGIVAVIFGIVALVTHNKKGLTIAGIVTGVFAIVITLVLQSAWSNALDQAKNEIDKTVDDATGENTDDLLGTDVDVQLGTFQAESDEYGFVTTALPVTVTNLMDESASFSITVEALNADGSRLALDYVYADSLGSNQSMSEDVFTFVTSDDLDAYQNATFQVIEVSKY